MSVLLFIDAHVRFGAQCALDGVTCAFRPGAITGIVGPNGAGKTTLLRAAAGLVRLASGAVQVFDRPVAEWPRDALARRVAYLPQGGDAAWPLPAFEVAALGRLPHGATLSRLPVADAAVVAHALARVDGSAFSSRRVDTLSAGERARVMFARALASRADVLLADEPAAHLDPAHQLQMMDLLREEAARGVAVAVTLHELALAARCDSLIVLAGGRIAADAPPDEALSDEVLARVFGVAAVRTAVADGRGVPVPWRRI
jgi:iron complex transport system ATP-binding protein